MAVGVHCVYNRGGGGQGPCSKGSNPVHAVHPVD